MACIQTYTDNYQIYLDICHEYDDIDNEIRRIIENRAIYKNACDLKVQLTVVGDALDYMQNDRSCFSKVYATWFNLVQNKDLTSYKKTIDKRFKEAMQPFHALAYLTDPTLPVDKIPIEKICEDEAYKWLEEEYPSFVAGVLYYNIKDPDIFPPSMFAESLLKDPHMSAAKWWLIMSHHFETNLSRCGDPDPDDEILTRQREQYIRLIDVSKFLIKLHSCPASSASLERTFSTFGYIWSSLRNKLGAEKVIKLVKIHRFLNNKNKPIMMYKSCSEL